LLRVITGKRAVFTVAKRNKRMWIDAPNDASYTPPDFVRPPDRKAFQDLADRLTAVGKRDIFAIAEFEYRYTPNKRRPR
jgi:hypothetical protein